MKKRRIQIDVIGIEPDFDSIRNDELIRCKLYLNGSALMFWTTKANYEGLQQEGFFVRSGKEEDCSGAINTTSVYVEE